MRTACLLLFGAVCAFSQPFGLGVKVGVPFSDFVDNISSGNVSNFKNPNRYILGLSGEVRLPFHLAIEADLLYRRVKYSAILSEGNVTQLLDARGNTWEIPVLGKYRFGEGGVRPFVDAGVSFNRLGDLTQTITSVVTGNRTEQDASTTRKGFVIGGGIEVKFLFLRLAPEIRYTRWGARRFFDLDNFFGGNQNQANFLLGISF